MSNPPPSSSSEGTISPSTSTPQDIKAPSQLTGIDRTMSVDSITQSTLAKHHSLRCLLRIRLTRTSRPASHFIAFATEVITEFSEILSESGAVEFNHDLLAIKLEKDRAVILFDVFAKDYPKPFRTNMIKSVNRSIYLVGGKKSGYFVVRRRDLDGLVRKEYEAMREGMKGDVPYFVDTVQRDRVSDEGEPSTGGEPSEGGESSNHVAPSNDGTARTTATCGVDVEGAFKFGEPFVDEDDEGLEDELMMMGGNAASGHGHEKDVKEV